jgi:hypothetical protein
MRSRKAALGLVCSAACAIAIGCGGQADRAGLDAWLRVPNARFIAGPLPAPSGGPPVQTASVSRQDISAGLQDRTLEAAIGLSSTGVAVGLLQDTGYWILPAGPIDVQSPTALTFATSINFSPLLPTGTFTLEVIALDDAGRAGAPFQIGLHTNDPGLPDAGLAFTLSWDTGADLDLHVVDARGAEIFWDHISADGATLDFDSNQSCAIDGLRRERIAWPDVAPTGHYVARVDTPSLCAAADAHWLLTAQAGASILKSASGQSIPSDTRGTHAAGAGVTALELDAP